MLDFIKISDVFVFWTPFKEHLIPVTRTRFSFLSSFWVVTIHQRRYTMNKYNIFVVKLFSSSAHISTTSSGSLKRASASIDAWLRFLCVGKDILWWSGRKIFYWQYLRMIGATHPETATIWSPLGIARSFSDQLKKVQQVLRTGIISSCLLNQIFFEGRCVLCTLRGTEAEGTSTFPDCPHILTVMT